MSRYNKNYKRNYKTNYKTNINSNFVKIIVSIMLLAVLAFGGFYMYRNYYTNVTVPPVVNIEDETDDIVLPGPDCFGSTAPANYSFISDEEIIPETFDLFISATNATVTILRDDVTVNAGEGVLTEGDILTIDIELDTGYILTTTSVKINGIVYEQDTITVGSNISISVVAYYGGSFY